MALFGTDGIRGKIGSDLSAKLCFDVSRAFGHYLRKTLPGLPVLLGKDTRFSGDMIESAISAGLSSQGVEVIKLGVITTPGLQYLCAYKECAGVMITASHNLAADNGIKLFSKGGLKLSPEEESYLEGFMNSDFKEEPPARIYEEDKFVEIYLNYLRERSRGIIVKGIVLDCANGSTVRFAPGLFNYLHPDFLYTAGCYPDGYNINLNCGSTHPDVICDLVRGLNKRSTIGFAFDGDGDRVIACDDRGMIVDGDDFLAVLSLWLKVVVGKRKFSVVGTVMTNRGLEEFLKKESILFYRSKVGDKNVYSMMKEKGALLGAETSGHVIIDGELCGDGMLAAIYLLRGVHELGLKRLNLFKKHFQIMKSVRLESRISSLNQEIIEKIEEFQKNFNGRIVVRPSGTEPLVRIMVESKSLEEAQLACLDICNMFEKKEFKTVS
ncbi:MAG: phosphoglucosamine mutase [Fervidicoccus fontis]|uniref:Phosphoglucosamine mutase n=1 Tax=Thermodesulfobium acidiphilum TaxID=1794699 RepID=A0A2R4VYD0_THEAF|nr:phosphoglucosamine mutase [Thermodesulfobium acidiphilum]AWB09525.1 phosphoglucosamine mutase [Thermodesulfobium acidiphilum]PMB76440.1 MAG: phosphoglucosamine mutase [Fervidicoccus fontis]HEM56309.1 phosphoglucosamine mutase [Thermodesulfobium narugense]